MRGTIWQLGLLMFAVCIASVVACPVHAADVQGARVWSGKDYTRLVFELSGPVKYKLFQLDNPHRVVLDLADSQIRHGFDGPGGSGLLKDVRTGRRPHGTRLVLDLNGATHPKSFVLKPSDGSGYRLVVDLYPKGKKMPAVAKAAPVTAASSPAHERKVIVAIDAGHGGKDPGSHGPSGLKEKTVTLAVAKDLARLVDKQPGMKAVLTRDGDYFIPLKRRFEIARQNNADLFISIHADAFRSADAKGSSVWVLSPRGKTSEAARWLADRENRADLIGGVSLDDKDDTLAAVLLDLQQGYAMQASKVVAGDVFHSLARIGPTHRDHIEHANFVVLRSPDVPSILVETAFITNPVEERKLRSPRHREVLAKAILGGVRKYFRTQPPPGTWFAAQWAKRHGMKVASTASHPVEHGKPGGMAPDAQVQDLHRVRRGETLSGIARQYGVSMTALKTLNKMQSDTVQAGAVLAIPTS
ncbi:N-acetylmuramoyl-L-alanine amidase [Oleiagrimonas sp. C23AA]|uniref:N-acetylmuramoyl-L-alanine amidase n=1 Tax=Oleiagrimonas sp. C23AA TaxID=2719047 RepID=UPI001421F613|nr:N-acetylmuramoyl-L-alanine amidase [Oleiagrimonas sp. C23AA]NII09135.1 AMIN domain-containing protein [Oleiagrimonas sp. C23AA]